MAEGAVCYTGNLASPAERLYTLDYYLRKAEQLVAAGVHVLCIKDMAGLLRAPAARTLVGASQGKFRPPVHLHTHDTAGGQLATYVAAVEAGVDAIDGAMGPLAGTTSQPSIGAIVAATDNTDRATGLSLDAIEAFEPYWEAVRRLYRPFDIGLGAPTTRVYRHEMPGGQISNLRQQAIALGLGDRYEMVEDLYAEANRVLGNIVKVTPSSKVVGDLALYLCGSNADIVEFERDPASFDLPDSVIGFLAGELGVPAGGLARALPYQGPGRQEIAARVSSTCPPRPKLPSSTPRTSPAETAPGAQLAAFPRAGTGVRGSRPPVRGPVRPADVSIFQRAGARRRSRGRRSTPACPCTLRRRHRRSGRERFPFGLLPAERPAPRGHRPRPVCEGHAARGERAQSDNPAHVAAPFAGAVP